MNTISNLKMRSKLLVGFLLVLGLMLLVGAFGVGRMGAMREVEEDLDGDHIPAMMMLADMRKTALEYKLREYAVIMGAQRDGAANDEKRLVETREAMSKLLVAYEARVEDPADRAFLDGARGSWGAYLAAQSPVLDLARQKHADEASRLATGALAEKHAELLQAISGQIAMENGQIDVHVGESGRAFQSGRAWVIGVVAGAFVIGILLALFIAAAVSRPLAEMRRVVGAAAAGDLTIRAQIRGKDELGETAASMNGFLEKLHDSMVQVAMAAGQVASASEQLSASAEELSSGAQEQASSLEETSASLEEITSTVKQSADNARQASSVALSSRDSADKGGEVVGTAVSAMAEINHSSKKISEIIGVIDEIAFQTNLLALNAAVEAARAGEQGRGFAVVAAEVRNLAQRSATAAKEIKVLIRDSMEKVDEGSKLVNASGATLQEIVTSVKRVTDYVSDIASASAEQASGIDQVNRAVSQMDQVVQSNSAQTEEMSATAEELAGQAVQLRKLVEKFSLAGHEDTQAVSSSSSPAARPASAGRPGAKRGRPARLRSEVGSPSRAARSLGPTDRDAASAGPSADIFEAF